METNVIPWEDVVNIKKSTDEKTLKVIEFYRNAAESENLNSSQRDECVRLMQKYQKIYLGHPFDKGE